MLLKGAAPLTLQAQDMAYTELKPQTVQKENMISYSLDRQSGKTDHIFATSDAGKMAVGTRVDTAGSSPQ